MATITYHQASGDSAKITVDDGTSIMRAAVSNGVDGIVGECGGQAMCATCHVYVREPFLEGLPEIGDEEEEMLDCTADERDGERSRLGCQLKAGAAFDSIEVDVPSSQV